jgi:hypothetical protein
MTMNKAVRFSAVRLHFTLSALAFLAVALVCGCSDSDKLAGTAVEPNELALESSSSCLEPEERLSSSELDEPQSSSSENEPASSSSEKPSESMLPEPKSSSSSVSPSDPFTNPAGLEDYASFYGVSDAQFDKTVIASAVVYTANPVSTADPPHTPDDSSDTGNQPVEGAVTELNSPGLHKMSGRLEALNSVFPESAKELVAQAQKAAAEDPSCETFLYNVRGQEGSIAHMLVGVASDTLTVLDIRDSNCRSTQGQVFGFVFIYCGEMNRAPYEKRTSVDRDPSAGKCPAQDLGYEWTE